jgi:hypothetical protein
MGSNYCQQCGRPTATRTLTGVKNQETGEIKFLCPACILQNMVDLYLKNGRLSNPLIQAAKEGKLSNSPVKRNILKEEKDIKTAIQQFKSACEDAGLLSEPSQTYKRHLTVVCGDELTVTFTWERFEGWNQATTIEFLTKDPTPQLIVVYTYGEPGEPLTIRRINTSARKAILAIYLTITELEKHGIENLRTNWTTLAR